jgi:hypothetical protein
MYPAWDKTAEVGAAYQCTRKAPPDDDPAVQLALLFARQPPSKSLRFDAWNRAAKKPQISEKKEHSAALQIVAGAAEDDGGEHLGLEAWT